MFAFLFLCFVALEGIIVKGLLGFFFFPPTASGLLLCIDVLHRCTRYDVNVLDVVVVVFFFLKKRAVACFFSRVNFSRGLKGL